MLEDHAARGTSPVMSAPLDELEAGLVELSALVESVRARADIGLSDHDTKALQDQAGRVAAAARYFLMGPKRFASSTLVQRSASVHMRDKRGRFMHSSVLTQDV